MKEKQELNQQQKEEFKSIMLQFAIALYPTWVKTNFIDGTDWTKEMMKQAALLTRRYLDYCEENL